MARTIHVRNKQPVRVHLAMTGIVRCPHCALLRHDLDAVYCKACGTLLDIPD